MLKDIDPLLTGRLLHLLDEMGHGDVLGLVDRNFPAYRYDVPVVEMRGVDTEATARALLQVLPLDDFVEHSVHRMEVDGRPEEETAATRSLQMVLDAAGAAQHPIASVERFAFYEKARTARLFVQTGETVPYSCYLIAKGVL